MKTFKKLLTTVYGMKYGKGSGKVDHKQKPIKIKPELH